MCLLATTGGGVAVLDYDADGWPDLYFTQGGSWPWTTAGQSPQCRDRLFRNLGNGQFADVTQEAGLGDDGYSQGVAAGDFDNDGWPDLYVANFAPIASIATPAMAPLPTSPARAELPGSGGRPVA